VVDIAATGPRDPKRSSRRAQEVLDVATDLFYRLGYAAASVQDVARELNITKGSVYHYITTKEDLLYWVVDEVHLDAEAIIFDIIALDGLSPLERLFEYVKRQVEFNLTNLARISVYYNEVDRLSASRRREVAQWRSVHVEFVTRMISQAQERGEVDGDLDIRLATAHMFAVQIWPYQWYSDSGRLTKQAIAEDCARFVHYGLTGQRAPGRASS